jgi:DNA primase
MTIQDIKSNLSLRQVLAYYKLVPDRNKMLLCPFHEDKTPSLQVNLDKDYYKCHACDKKGDQIQFVQDMEKCSKHEALLKCTQMTGIPINQSPITDNREPITMKTNFLEQLYETFVKSIYLSQQGKDYLKSRALEDLLSMRGMVGFNGGQFHHAGRFENEENAEEVKREFIKKAVELGMLIPLNRVNNRTGEAVTYQVFGNKSLVFPLRNKQGEIVSFYFRSVLNTANQESHRHFYLKNRQGLYPNYPKADTKKLILTEAIIDAVSLLQIKEITQEYSIIACFGTNGLNDEILQAIKDLKELEEIIFIFDQDKAGNEATQKYAEIFKSFNLLNLSISKVGLPSKDVNETLQGHEKEIFTELLNKRQSIFSSTEQIQTPITDNRQPTTNFHQPTTNHQPIDFLKHKNLLKHLNELIGKAGIVGEENSRMLLFLIIISYLNKNPLHGLVQGSSGSGKTHIISRIADLMPQEDVLRFTRITESSLYNWGEFDLFQKVIIIEDLDGLKEEALYSLREFISNQVLRSSVSMKDKKGNNKSTHKIVKGQFSSLSATTKGETYEDNMSRSFLIAIDESKEQTARIIQYQNKKNAGEIDTKEEQKAIHFIQSIVKNLKVYEVVNPYATQLQLPEKVHKVRRLNEMYQSVIKQVTFLNQYQRKQTADGKLITTIEDIQEATEILFESIVLKVDELDGSLRQFFEKLKKYVKTEAQEFLQRDIRQEFNMSKTQVQRYINTLLELEYIKQSGGFNNKGIKYKISYWDNHQKLRNEIKAFLNHQIGQLKTKKVD